MIRTLLCAVSILTTLTVATSAADAAKSTQTLQVGKQLQVPGKILKPGTYTISLEDRLNDRAIVRISGANDTNDLFLTVPSDQVTGRSLHGLVLFKTSTDDEILRGWKCPNCSSPVEFAYPKLEAVKITDETTQPVLAVDPEYDKLPSNLTAEDMKVVTLWLLSPERITASNKGEGVKAAKYKVANQPASKTEVAGVTRKHLPKTASDTFSFLLYGLIALAAAISLRLVRMRFEPKTSHQ